MDAKKLAWTGSIIGAVTMYVYLIAGSLLGLSLGLFFFFLFFAAQYMLYAMHFGCQDNCEKKPLLQLIGASLGVAAIFAVFIGSLVTGRLASPVLFWIAISFALIGVGGMLAASCMSLSGNITPAGRIVTISSLGVILLAWLLCTIYGLVTGISMFSVMGLVSMIAVGLTVPHYAKGLKSED